MNSLIQISLDIATSISVIGAAITYVFSQKKRRMQSQAQYAVSHLIDFQKRISKSRKSWKLMGDNLRRKAITLEDNNKIEIRKLLNSHLLEIILFLEELQDDIRAEVQVYFPIFTGKQPDSLSNILASLEKILSKAKLSIENTDEILEVISDIEKLITNMESASAQELKNIMQEC